MTKDISALDRQIASAAQVRVFDDGLTSDQLVSRSPALELHEPGDLQRLRSALAVAAVPDELRMCIGDAAFEFLDVNGASLATIGLHHGTHIRWSFWDGDALLSDGIGLLHWLADAGFTAPLERHRQDLERRAVAAAQAQAWSDAVPEPLSDLIPRMLATSQTGVIDSDLIGLASDRMAASFPDAVERCQMLLEWFAAGSGRCSGFPVHEGVVGQLLSRESVDAIVSAATRPGVSEAVERGALRALAGWKARPVADFQRIPDGLRARLVELASGDSDKEPRIRSKFRP